MERSFNSSSGSMSGSHHSDHADASQILKELLNVGKPSPIQPVYNMSGGGSSQHSMDGTSVDAVVPGNTSQDFSQAGGDSALPRSLTDSVRQTIVLTGDDRNGSVPVYGRDVNIIPSEASRRDSSAPGSSKVKITPVVKYDWEHKYYIGNMVAVNQIYLVYVLKIQSGFGLRILNRRTSVRALLKGFEDIITDVAFAHHQSNVLGCIDRQGNLTVWQIMDVDGKIMPTPKLKVTRPAGSQPTDYHRLVWCPYLPDDPSGSDNSSISDENSRLLAITHDEKAEFWDLEIVTEMYGNVVNASNVSDGVIRVYNGHSKPITDLSIAPDGQVLATASEDGTVKFWQMDMSSPDQTPSRLHRFSPHDGKPLSALLFCDNHKYQDPDLPFWRFLITGACSNQELMMWCTVTWTCLQRLSFVQPGISPGPLIKVKLDLSASFLIVTDINRKVMYVLQVHQDHHDGHAHLSSITDFLLTQPMLSYAIVDAGRCRLKQLLEDVEDGEELNSGELLEMVRGDADNGQGRSNGMIVKMFCINSRSVQDLQVRFQPNSSVEQETMAGSVSTASMDGGALQDGLSDMSMNETDRSVRSTFDLSSSTSTAASGHLPCSPLTSSFTSESNHSSQQPYLMTPEAIKSSSARTLAEHLRESNSTSITTTTSNSSGSFTQLSAMNASLDSSEPARAGVGDGNGSVNDPETPVSSITPTAGLTADLRSPQRPEARSSSSSPPPALPPPLQPEAGVVPDRDDEDQGGGSEDEGPKSPPPTPTELGSTAELVARTAASADDLAGLLESARLRGKRLSDSSAEVAQIMQSHAGDEDPGPQDEAEAERAEAEVEEEEEESEEESEEEEEEPVPVVQDAIPIGASPGLMEEAPEGVSVEPVEVAEANILDLAVEEPLGREVVVISPTRDNNRGAGLSSKVNLAEDSSLRKGLAVDQWPEDMGPPQLPADWSSPRSERSLDTERDDSTSSPGARSKVKDQQRGDKAGRTSPPRPSQAELAEETRRDMSEMTSTLQQVLGLLQSQQQELRQLKQDLARGQQSSSGGLQSLRSRVDKLDKSLAAKMETTMAKQSEQERQRLSTALQERQSMDKQKQERLLECVSQNLNKSVTSRLDKTVRSEIEHKVVPEIGKIIAPISEQMSTVLSQKLTATDQLMRENISKLVKSRNTTDAIGQAAANALGATMQTTYREAFRSSVVPAFEQSCQALFQQVNKAFEAGTRQYTHQLETHLSKAKQQEREDRDPILAELIGLVETFKASSDTLKDSLLASVQAELTKQLQASNEKVEQDILGKVRKLLKDELQSALRDHQSSVESSLAAVVRSQAPTPVPQGPDIRQVQSHINNLLQQGHTMQAFQSALSASDLRAVLFACQAVNADQLFETNPFPLDQPVLLSLIQQLSHDLGHTTVLKLKYIEESLMVLAEDRTTSQYHEHLPIVIGDLCRHITAFLQQNPSHVNAKKMKRVLMLAQSLKSSNN